MGIAIEEGLSTALILKMKIKIKQQRC